MRDYRDHLQESDAQALRHISSLEQQLQEISKQQRLRAEHFQVRSQYYDACDELARANHVYATLLDKGDCFRILLCELQDQLEETRIRTTPVTQALRLCEMSF